MSHAYVYITYTHIYILCIYTVDGKYKQSGFIWKELDCGFHCPPYPLNSMLGSSGRVAFSFLGRVANIELGG